MSAVMGPYWRRAAAAAAVFQAAHEAATGPEQGEIAGLAADLARGMGADVVAAEVPPLAHRLRAALEELDELDDPLERSNLRRAIWDHLRATDPERIVSLSDHWRPTEPIRDPREDQDPDDGSTPTRAA